jgi:hypothetical protein
MSKFGDVLEENGIALEALVRQSSVMERFTTRDRDLMNQRAIARGAKKSYADAGADKPNRYGRGLTMRTVRAAAQGAAVSRISRKKIIRALNAILEHQSKDPVDARLFDDTRPAKSESED